MAAAGLAVVFEWQKKEEGCGTLRGAGGRNRALCNLEEEESRIGTCTDLPRPAPASITMNRL